MADVEADGWVVGRILLEQEELLAVKGTMGLALAEEEEMLLLVLVA